MTASGLRGVLASLAMLGTVPDALAQAPAPAPGGGNTQPAAPTTTIDQERGADTTRAPVPRSGAARPGFAPPPMNIRIQGDGVKMPSCSTESREGEACKK